MAYKPTKVKPAEENGIYVYVGPSIRGVIQNGSIYRGSRESVAEFLGPAIEKFPMIKRLVVRDTEIAEAREKINHGNNSLSIAYRELSKT